MPANKRSARRSKSFKKCSRNGRPGCSRNKKSCTWDSRRKPRCQPKSARKKSVRKPSARRPPKKAAPSALGGLMDKSEIEANGRARKCASANDVADPNGCMKGCEYDEKVKRCVPKDPTPDPVASFSKFMDGNKYLTFRSNKKPAFSFRIPINADTLFGKYSGAIRFAPATGRLHLCYGPLQSQATDVGANRPVLSMLVKPKLSENLWTWYLSSGMNLQKKRMRELADKKYVSYTEIYALPGASYQLSYTEANYLEATCKDIDDKISNGEDLPFGLKGEDVPNGGELFFQLANAPTSCPPVLQGVAPDTGCLESLEFDTKGMDDVMADEDYNQLAVLGHAPSKRQRKLLSESDDDGTPRKEKKEKKEKKTKEAVRSPVPKRFEEKLDVIDNVLTASLAKEKKKAIEARANPTPDGRALGDIFKYLKTEGGEDGEKEVYLRVGYEHTDAFRQFRQIVQLYYNCLDKIDFMKKAEPDARAEFVGTSSVDLDDFDGRDLGERGGPGVQVVIHYLKDLIPQSRLTVCHIKDKSISTNVENTAMLVVQRLLVHSLLSLKTPAQLEISMRCSFIASLCLAWLKVFRDIYEPHGADSIALKLPMSEHPRQTRRKQGHIPRSSGEHDLEEMTKELAYLTSKEYHTDLIRSLGCTGLLSPYDVVSMLKDVYRFSDERCEGALLDVEAPTSRTYRSSTKDVSRRARARARKYISDSDSSSSSDSD